MWTTLFPTQTRANSDLLPEYGRVSFPVKLFVSLILLFISAIPVRAQIPPSRRMFVEPSSSSVALGRANLVVTPLCVNATSYAGKYQLKVTPYFFKSEKGTLILAAPEVSTEKLAAGNPVEFTGKATNTGNGKVKAITGKITPANKDCGAVTFSVSTDNGLMVFNTSYHFEP